MPERRWRVVGRGRRLFAIEVDDGGGFRAATAAEGWTRRCGNGSCSGWRSIRCSAPARPASDCRCRLTAPVNLVALMDELYAVGVVGAAGPAAAVRCGSVFPSLGMAVPRGVPAGRRALAVPPGATLKSEVRP